MLEGIVLDALLVLILLMMIPLGFLRGGLREVCTSAGLLMGVLLAQQWTVRIGDLLTDRIDMRVGLAEFVAAVVVVVLTTGVVGYGGSAAFAYRPGPGGRMYGAYLALLNGLVFIGFLVNAIIDAFYDGELPSAVENAYVSRALSVGFEWVLLLGAIGVLGATIFGMFVRERSDEPFEYEPRPFTAPPSSSATSTMKHPSIHAATPHTQPERDEPVDHRPVRIREVRHWENQPETRPQPSQGYGGGWRQTWPDSRGQNKTPAWEQQPTQPSSKGVPGKPKQDVRPDAGPGRANQRDVLRDWLKEDDSSSDS